MMCRYGKLLICALVAVALASCARNRTVWYGIRQSVDQDKADVFYLVSTCVMHDEGEDGETVYLTDLEIADRIVLAKEMKYMKEVFGDSLNFFAPFYHQFTAEAINLPEEQFDEVFEKVVEETCAIFDEYMEKYNGGRRFILAGFSQGAKLIPYLLRHMTDEQYSRMVAAYMMGFQLTDEDLEHKHIVAADNADDFGETVSFNSALSASSSWDFVSGDPACCINPVTWTTDDRKATMQYNGDEITVSVDPESNLLIIGCKDPSKYEFAPLEDFTPEGNMHHWDILFYADYIRKNALHRAYPSQGR